LFFISRWPRTNKHLVWAYSVTYQWYTVYTVFGLAVPVDEGDMITSTAETSHGDPNQEVKKKRWLSGTRGGREAKEKITTGGS
jgi:hypothetical protein